MRPVFFPCLATLVVLGAGIAIWPRSEPSGVTGARNSSTSSADSQTHLGNRRPTSSLRREMGLGSAASKNPLIQRLLAGFFEAQVIEDPMERNEALGRWLEGLSPEMAASLLALLSPEQLKGDAAQRLFDHWATARPREAALWATSHGDGETRQSFARLAAMRWAVADLDEAAAWSRSLPEGESRSEIMAAVASEAVRGDPHEALRLAEELPSGAKQDALILRALAEWAATEKQGALKWAEQIKDESLRQSITGQIAVASAETNSAEAANLVLQQMTPGVEQDRALVSIVQRWVQTEPEAAAAWVMDFPEGAIGQDAMDNLVSLWASKDLAAPGKWLLTLEAGKLRNAGILAYSQVLSRTDATAAERWKSLVPDVN